MITHLLFLHFLLLFDNLDIMAVLDMTPLFGELVDDHELTVASAVSKIRLVPLAELHHMMDLHTIVVEDVSIVDYLANQEGDLAYGCIQALVVDPLTER